MKAQSRYKGGKTCATAVAAGLFISPHAADTLSVACPLDHAHLLAAAASRAQLPWSRGHVAPGRCRSRQRQTRGVQRRREWHSSAHTRFVFVVFTS